MILANLLNYVLSDIRNLYSGSFLNRNSSSLSYFILHYFQLKEAGWKVDVEEVDGAGFRSRIKEREIA